MSVRDDIYRALHDAIGWQRGLVDAHKHMQTDPEYAAAKEQIRRYKAILKRRYPERAPADPFKGARLVDLNELRKMRETK